MSSHIFVRGFDSNANVLSVTGKITFNDTTTILDLTSGSVPPPLAFRFPTPLTHYPSCAVVCVCCFTCACAVVVGVVPTHRQTPQARTVPYSPNYGVQVDISTVPSSASALLPATAALLRYVAALAF
jgi:hypothetical protein